MHRIQSIHCILEKRGGTCASPVNLTTGIHGVLQRICHENFFPKFQIMEDVFVHMNFISVSLNIIRSLQFKYGNWGIFSSEI